VDSFFIGVEEVGMLLCNWILLNINTTSTKSEGRFGFQSISSHLIGHFVNLLSLVDIGVLGNLATLWLRILF
jgi:hypothetical protein